MKVVVLAGGISTERDVSLISGKMIYQAMKRLGHQAVLLDVFLGMERDDIDHIFESDEDFSAGIEAIHEINPDISAVKALRKDGGKCYFGPNVIKICQMADVVFLGLHGADGEGGKVQAAFDRVAFFMDNDSWFIFDVNTLYKHEKVLGNNTYIYDLADIYCAWQNRYNPQDHSVAISLDFFEKEGKVYTRSSEHFFEHAYSVEKLTEMLKKSGFDRVEIFGDLSFDAPKPEEQRIIFAAHITNSQNGVFKDDIAP